MQEFFDDCPICRAMKEAQKEGKNLEGEELVKAFGEAKKQGGVVGIGEDLENLNFSYEKNKRA